MLFRRLGSLDDKSEERNNSILPIVSFWPILQQYWCDSNWELNIMVSWWFHVSWHLLNGLLVHYQSYIMCDLVDVDSKSLREECQDKLCFKAFEVRTNQNNQLNTSKLCVKLCVIKRSYIIAMRLIGVCLFIQSGLFVGYVNCCAPWPAQLLDYSRGKTNISPTCSNSCLLRNNEYKNVSDSVTKQQTCWWQFGHVPFRLRWEFSCVTISFNQNCFSSSSDSVTDNEDGIRVKIYKAEMSPKIDQEKYGHHKPTEPAV